MKDGIFNEILEHTIDCDYSRSLHFKMNEHYSKLDKGLEIAEISLLLTSIAIYTIYFTFASNIDYKTIAFVVALISIITTLIAVLSYIFKFDKLANSHWISAQTYSRIYRECQFFHVHNFNKDISQLSQKANDISNELCDINLLSPQLADRYYHKVDKDLKNKRYPISDLIRENRHELILEIVHAIKDSLGAFEIEIILFGSYLNKSIFNDIDLAVFIDSNINCRLEVEKNLLQIEKDFLAKNITIDIVLVTETDLLNASKFVFLKNVCSGSSEYRDSNIQCSLKDKSIKNPDFSEIINSLFCEVAFAFSENKIGLVTSKIYECYYQIISGLLCNRHLYWNSESEMIKIFYELSKENSQFEVIYDSFSMFKKIKISNNFSLLDYSILKDNIHALEEAVSAYNSNIL